MLGFSSAPLCMLMRLISLGRLIGQAAIQDPSAFAYVAELPCCAQTMLSVYPQLPLCMIAEMPLLDGQADALLRWDGRLIVF